MNTKNNIIFTFITVGVISAFLPWMKLTDMTVGETPDIAVLNMNNLLFLVGMLTLAVIVFLGRKKEVKSQNYQLITKIISRLLIMLLLMFYVSPMVLKSTNGFQYFNQSISLGFILAVIAIIGIFVTMSIRTKEEQNWINQLG